jgi:hypothetical protein
MRFIEQLRAIAAGLEDGNELGRWETIIHTDLRGDEIVRLCNKLTVIFEYVVTREPFLAGGVWSDDDCVKAKVNVRAIANVLGVEPPRYAGPCDERWGELLRSVEALFRLQGNG